MRYRQRMRQQLVTVFFVVLGMSASRAEAYCRAATEDPKESSCSCTNQGIPLAWRVRHVNMELNERGFADFSDDDVRALEQRALDTWSDVDCNGKPMGMSVSVVDRTTSYEIGPACDAGVAYTPDHVKCEPNDNALIYYSGAEWLEQSLSDRAFAFTSVWFNKVNGEILGADTYFNGGMGKLADCPDAGCPAGTNDYLDIATHEAGHFYGLAHSDSAHSTMWCMGDAGELEKRTLDDDDTAGICAIYGSNADFKNTSKGGCSVSAVGAPAPWFAISTLLSLYVLRRRSKRAA